MNERGIWNFKKKKTYLKLFRYTLNKKFERDKPGAENHNIKVRTWELLKKVKIVFSSIGRMSDIAGYLIHLNKNKTKWKSKTTQWLE